MNPLFSPAVNAALAVRMDASVGEPTVLQKIAAKFGFGAEIGMTPEEIASTLAGDNADLTKGGQVVLGAFQHILSFAETDGVADLTNVLTTLLTLIPGVSSVAGAVKVVLTVLEAEAGPLQAQATALGQTSLTTLVSAILASLGKVNLPLTPTTPVS